MVLGLADRLRLLLEGHGLGKPGLSLPGRSAFQTGPEGPPIGAPDHKMLWSGTPGRPGCGLLFHEVVEKV